MLGNVASLDVQAGGVWAKASAVADDGFTRNARYKPDAS